MEPERLPIVKAAQILGVNPWTLRRKTYRKTIPCIISDTGHRYIPMSWIRSQLGETPSSDEVRCALYARESSSENKSALESQVNGLRLYAKAKGYQIVHVVSEFGSGVNDERKKLHTLLNKRDFNVLLVEHKDRLTRFGFHWFESLCPFRIEVINVAENDTHDLMDDLVAIITSFSARLYGQRRGRKKTQAAIKALREVES
ncbi:MAG: IS607 family transposase [Dehalococcoidia bacterium]